MSYIIFDKNQLVNLEYSLSRELCRSNRGGSYSNTTIINCNTRKYHGLLITPQPGVDNENHVLLSSLDETVIQQDAEFHLAIHKFPGNVYEPKGHKYLRDFSIDMIPKLTYRVGGVLLTKEMIFTREDRMMIRYTLVDAHSPTRIQLKPFLAFRNIHALSKENIIADKKFEPVVNGIKVRMYQGYSDLYIQLSKSNEYTHAPDWFYNIEYQEEQKRGYEFQEDLYVPGFFEFDMKKGESVCFSAGISPILPRQMKKAFTDEMKRRVPRDSFEHCLVNASQQFVVRRDSKTELLAGFPWYGMSARHTFISLPGLLLVKGEFQLAKEVLENMKNRLRGPLFPSGSGKNMTWNEADAPLWFFWALQQYAMTLSDRGSLWVSFGNPMRQILEGYRDGIVESIFMNEKGLISASLPATALTWMDAYAYGRPVTPRTGLTVEINALWYNAVCFGIEIASLAGDQKFVDDWKPVAGKIQDHFLKTFWSQEKRYLSDYIDGTYTDWSVRPNMIFVSSLPYTPVPEEIRKEILSIVKRELLTPRGLRTLTPQSPVYKSSCSGNITERETSAHQGTVWPWLLGHFAEGYLRIHGKSGLGLIKNLYSGFEPAITEHGVGTISECYDGDPPHQPGGAISFASSVAEILRLKSLIDKYEKE